MIIKKIEEIKNKILDLEEDIDGIDLEIQQHLDHVDDLRDDKEEKENLISELESTIDELENRTPDFKTLYFDITELNVLDYEEIKLAKKQIDFCPPNLTKFFINLKIQNEF